MVHVFLNPKVRRRYVECDRRGACHDDVAAELLEKGGSADDHGVCDPLMVHCVRLRVGNLRPRRE